MAKTDWIDVHNKTEAIIERRTGADRHLAQSIAYEISERVFGEGNEMSPFDRILRLRETIRGLNGALARTRRRPRNIHFQANLELIDKMAGMRCELKRLKDRTLDLEKERDALQGRLDAYTTAKPDQPIPAHVDPGVGVTEAEVIPGDPHDARSRPL